MAGGEATEQLSVGCHHNICEWRKCPLPSSHQKESRVVEVACRTGPFRRATEMLASGSGSAGGATAIPLASTAPPPGLEMDKQVTQERRVVG